MMPKVDMIVTGEMFLAKPFLHWGHVNGLEQCGNGIGMFQGGSAESLKSKILFLNKNDQPLS